MSQRPFQWIRMPGIILSDPPTDSTSAIVAEPWTAIKRGLDILLSVALVPVLIPIWVVLAILIKLESKGPIIFCQTRIGKGGRPFVLYKFRTMMDGAEQDTGPVWAKSPDPRATRFGGVIRRFGLDETIQVVNVLIGNMSLVGPRPERPYFVEKLRSQIPDYNQRLVAKPGITGLAQVHTDHKYDVSLEDVKTKVAYDLAYIRTWSLMLDLKILVLTVFAVLRMRPNLRRQ